MSSDALCPHQALRRIALGPLCMAFRKCPSLILQGRGICEIQPKGAMAMLKLKYTLSLAMLVGMTSAALAAEFFIVQGPEKKCWIVEKRPTETSVTIVGGKVYV